MEQSAIRVGAKYSNPTSRYGGVRVVDAIVLRSNGNQAVVWTRSGAGEGHDSGVSLLATFARWARAEEAMTSQDLREHERRASAHAQARAALGPVVAQFMASAPTRA